MRRITGVGVTAALLAVLAGPGAAQARAPHPKCFPKGGQTDAASNRLRIFQIGDPSSEAVAYACDLKTGLRRKLWETGYGEGQYANHARFVGTAVAWREDWFLKHLSYQSVGTLEMKSGRFLSGGLGGGELTDLEVAPSGSAAYAWRKGLDAGVVSLTPAGQKAVETSRDVESGSVGLSRLGRIFWTSAGEARSAQLDATPAREPPPFSASRRGSCQVRGSRTLAAGTYARVYAVGPEEKPRTYVCHLGSGRRIEAGTAFPSGGPQIDRAAFAGRYVALAERGCNGSLCGRGVIELFDLHSGKRRTPYDGLGSDVSMSDLVLREDGAIAWIRNRLREAVACGGDGQCRTLDEGDGIEPGSLADARLGRLYWTNAGVPRSAPFGGPR